jgi:hypothetical protein
MNWSDKVFRYCERGADPAFWAEPLNAVSNVAFLIAAVAAAWRMRAVWRADAAAGAAPDNARWRGSDRAVAGLIALVFAIGVGSFLFHTVATRWARLADVIPIVVFMLAYLMFALRHFLALSWAAIAGSIAVFLAATASASAFSCPSSLVSVTAYAREPCLKETLGYAPALAALLLVAGAIRRQHPAARNLLTAAGVFVVAMLLRWTDRGSCPFTTLFGAPRGTHALWHLLNAIVLYMLLSAAMAHRRVVDQRPAA